MSQSKTTNQKPCILQNHILNNNRAYGKHRVGAEGSNPIQVVTRTVMKTIRTLEITTTDKKMFSISYYRINMGLLPKSGVAARVQDGKHTRKD